MTEQSKNKEQDISSEELAGAKDVVQSIVKSSKAFKMYLPNNPLHQKFFASLLDKLTAFLDEFGSLDLKISQFTLSYESEVIYENHDIKESFAFKLYSDGIIALSFLEDINEVELKAFMDILGENYDISDDDIATRLWLSDLPNIEYKLAREDSFVDTGELGIRESETVKEEDGVKKASQEAAEEEPPLTPVMAPQQMFSLSKEEEKWLEDAKKEEEEKNPIDEIGHILYCIIAVEKDEALFAEFLKITIQMIRDLIVAYDLDNSTSLIRRFQVLSMQEDFPVSHREPLLFALDDILDNNIAEKIGIGLSSHDLNPEKLNELLLLVGRNASEALCHIIGFSEKNKAAQQVIIAFLSKHGERATKQIVHFLEDKRPHLVSAILQILFKKGDYSAVDHVGRLVTHSEEKIKREALQYLKDAESEKSTRYLLKLTEDENIALRMRALKVMANPLYSSAFDNFISVIDREDFEEREMAERATYFETIAEVDSDNALEFIKKQLSKKFWFNKSGELESNKCVAAGLSKMGTKPALEILEYAVNTKKGENREIFEQAIKSFKIR